MAILTEGARNAQFLVSEANGFRSRGTGTVTVAVGGFSAGTVLGKITASGKYVRVDSTKTDGSEDEAAILYENLTESGDVDATLVLRDAEVVGAHLTYEDGADDAGETAANVALAALGIIVR